MLLFIAVTPPPDPIAELLVKLVFPLNTISLSHYINCTTFISRVVCEAVVTTEVQATPFSVHTTSVATTLSRSIMPSSYATPTITYEVVLPSESHMTANYHKCTTIAILEGAISDLSHQE